MLRRATELMKNNQYNDALPLLLQDIRGISEDNAAKHQFLIGECYYMTKRYQEAKPWLAKAARNAQGEEKAAIDYRLAGVAFRLADFPEALTLIEAFQRDHPDDERLGKLLVYKMAIVARKGKGAEKDLENVQQYIQKNLRQYGYPIALEADGLLSEFYRKNNENDQALAVYARTVQTYRRIISDLEKDGRAVPAATQRYHDSAALSAGQLCLELNRSDEAVKMLENVRYVPEMVMKARLYLAKGYYDKQSYASVLQLLTENNYVEKVPDPVIRSDMYLILGMSEKNRKEGNEGAASVYLRKVGSEAKGYPQAQITLAVLYHERGQRESAEKAYSVALGYPDYAPAALNGLGRLYLEQGRDLLDEKLAREQFLKSAQMHTQLLTKYPLSGAAKECRARVEELRRKGIEVGAVTSEEDLVQQWKKNADQKKGTVEGAQALLSLMRHYARVVRDEKTRKVLKAADYKACAEVCDRFLDPQVYGGPAFADSSWQTLKAEANFQRGACELASVSPPASRSATAVYLETADVERAVDFLTAAKRLVDPKKLDLVKQIELALLEGLFKSSNPERRAAAEKRFQEMEPDYGGDPRFQKLALDLGAWFQEQKRWVEAAKAYETLGDRGKELPEEDILKSLYLAGTLYSQAAMEAQEKTDAKAYAVYIYPKEAVQVSEDPLKTYRPLQKVLTIRWPSTKELTALEALQKLSVESGLPFVWPPAGGRSGIAEYLAGKRCKLSTDKKTVAAFLGQIVDLTRYRVAFDLGFTGGQPTIALKTNDLEPEDERAQTLELYDSQRPELRYEPLSRSYGSWDSIHSSRQQVMLMSILARAEHVMGTKVVWAEGVDKERKQEAEFREPPGLGRNGDYSCSKILAAVLENQGLRFKIVRRDQSTDLFEKARECFNKLCKIAPSSKYGERGIYLLAANAYQQREYQNMRAFLRVYFKIFDNPSHELYHEACFLMGWLLEQDQKYREACGYYAKAAEERLVVYRPAAPATLPDKETLRKQLAEDTQFALAVPVKGEFKETSLSQFMNFIEINTKVPLRLDPQVDPAGIKMDRPEFKYTPAFDVLHDGLAKLGLSVRGESVDGNAAERAYFRLATVYKKDDQMEQALENCNLLLARFPETKRKRDVLALKLEVYKGLKDYSNVMSTLEALRAMGGSEAEAFRFDSELAAIHFDLCNYTRAAELYKSALNAAKDVEDVVPMREGYGRSLLRCGKLAEALAQYQELAKQDPTPIGRFVDGLLIYYLQFLQGQKVEAEFPEEGMRFIVVYEKLSDKDRERLDAASLAKVTWIYYVLGMMDIKKGRLEEGLVKLNAATSCPDDMLAGEAGFQMGNACWQARDKQGGYVDKAREAFEHVLFTTKSTESAVRATYVLGLCFRAAGQTQKAQERFDEILKRYPASSFADQIRNEKGKTP